MKIFNLPDLGEGLPEAEIHQWHVKTGDTVKMGEPMVSVETAKAIVDVPAPYNGRIMKLYGQAGDIIKTGSPLIAFDDAESEANISTRAATVVGHLETSNIILEPENSVITSEITSVLPNLALPVARILAKKWNVEPSQIQAIKGPRRMMAMTMAQSHAEVVPVTIVDDANIHHWPAETDITVRILRAMIAACHVEPGLNAWFDGKAVARCLLTDVNVGIAMDSPEGLFVPVIREAQNKTDIELRTAINTFKEQVKTRTIAAEDLRGSSIMLSNFGTFAGRYATPILVPPVVAILGVGRIYEAVVAIEGQPAVRRTVSLSLTCDHRAVTGGEAARFLGAVIQNLQQ